ncbi:hypothetical protein CesoFtcFv8_008925 [Champsocephalus esox]|uniref:Transmembrane protein n=3 Tax=Channichthyidae TaxID=30806 RepID=A0AAN8DQ91_CHAGU|nr:hypothetical protein KUCAC02_015265 [Chaenocephalus aceratus]KAK5899444.1 hypothetical protein CesoFtcFv8_008925 [Champsocephalus esox]KAK5926552.1 hypothetical protein CgunFtcFv8_022114 [Champsocephalus gunnari]
MEPLVRTVTAGAAYEEKKTFPRKAMRAKYRGASSHFVGSSIIILSSFAISSLAMNCGKKIQASRHKSIKN